MARPQDGASAGLVIHRGRAMARPYKGSKIELRAEKGFESDFLLKYQIIFGSVRFND